MIIFTNLANIFAYMTIIVRSMYNFVNCLQLNIRYEKVERPAPVGGALVKIKPMLGKFIVGDFIIKDEILLTESCTIFLFIATYLFTGSFKNRSIDI